VSGEVLHRAFSAGGDHYLFFCPGCQRAHFFDSRWTFNGDLVKPSFRASLSVPGCHSFVTNGMIQFLPDSTHALAGQTVPMVPWETRGEETR
jgi:hypothetical protein